MSNKKLNLAKKNKNDEFYTQYKDIEKEIANYKGCLKGKIIYCNCDDYRWSSFYKHFKDNFHNLKLKKLISTCYIKDGKGLRAEYNGVEENISTLKSDGDYKSQECVETLKQADVIVTNPPFSLFRGYIDLLVKYNKDFIVISNQNAINCKEIFPLIKKGIIKLGTKNIGDNMFFINKDNIESLKKVSALWLTTFNVRNNNYLELTEKYIPEKYPKYDNYDAINVDKVKDIPKDYYESMGVPISFLNKYNSNQFKIIGLLNSSNEELAGIKPLRTYEDFIEVKQDGVPTGSKGSKINGNSVLAGKPAKGNYYVNKEGYSVYSKYSRIIIQRIKEDCNE